MRNDPKGSVWRQWDFHFHTPASYDYEDMSVTDQQIVDGLLRVGDFRRRHHRSPRHGRGPHHQPPEVGRQEPDRFPRDRAALGVGRE